MYVKNEVNEVEDTYLTFTTPNLIQIFVINLSGDSQAIFVDTHNTVLELKYIIQDKLEYDIKLIRLEFANRRLEDHRTLRSYNIQQGDNVHISLRLLGG
ncbi:ubiquitin-like protein, partial [Rhizophagus irregularis]